MTQKWNLQDIRPPEPRKRRRPTSANTTKIESTNSTTEPSEPQTAPEPRNREDIPNIVIENGTKKGSKRFVVSIGLFVLIVGGALVLSMMLGKTVLTINPQHRTPNISAEFTAYPEPRDGELSYEILELEATKESQVSATGQVDVQEQATGEIEIIKSTPGAERLIKNTRFRSPEGLVYRIEESVVVPGSVEGVPGTIKAEVFADQVGPEYNLDAGVTFDIPGFEEGGFTELYDAISARNPEPITGGFDGPQFQIDDDELETARQALQAELRNSLLEKIDTEKPAGFIAFPRAVAITYEQLPAVESGDSLVTIREKATLQIPLFQTSSFANFLAEETIPTYEGNPVRITDPSALNFDYSSPTTSQGTIIDKPSLTFNLTGKPQLIWEYDATKLKQDLAGLPKSALQNIPASYPAIVGASVQITPFWKRTFPEDPESIEIQEVLKEL